MALKGRVSVTLAAGMGTLALACAPATPVLASPTGQPSGYCNDGVGNETEVPILTTPITLAVEIGHDGLLANPHIGLCYATTPEGSASSGLAGGDAGFYVFRGNPNGVDVFSFSDQGAAVQASAEATAYPTWTITPAPPGTTGDTIMVSVPFVLCVGGCSTETATLNPTGVLVGQLVPVSHPGIGAAYELQSIEVLVDGIPVVNATGLPAGAYVDPFGALAQSLDFTQGGPCLAGVCVPQGYVETTGGTLMGVQILGHIVDVTPPKRCLYTNPSGQCP